MRKGTVARPSAGPYGQAPTGPQKPAMPRKDMSANLGKHLHPKGGMKKGRYA